MQTDERSRRRLERDIEEEEGDDYVLDLKKNYDLPSEEKYDVIPEIWDGHNIADFIDTDIESRLLELEREEEELEKSGHYDLQRSDDDEEEMTEIRQLASRIREKKAINKINQKIDTTGKPRVPRSKLPRKRERSVSGLRAEFRELGCDISSDEETHYEDAVRETVVPKLKRAREDDEGVVRDSSLPSRDEMALADPAMRAKAKTLRKKSQRGMKRSTRRGEADRVILNAKPKHLYAGKRGLGKAHHR